MSSKKPASAKARQQKTATDPQVVADECVDLLLERIQQHIEDKFIFPRTLAYAVGRTMAEMVHMVGIAHIQRMENWLVALEGSAPEEWDLPKEPLVPEIDSWARGVVPVQRLQQSQCSSPSTTYQQQQEQQQSVAPRRGSAMSLMYQQSQQVPRRSSTTSRRGSLRRFNDAFLQPLDPSRKVKFQDGAGIEQGVTMKSVDADNYQDQVKSMENKMMSDLPSKESVARRPSITKVNSNSK